MNHTLAACLAVSLLATPAGNPASAGPIVVDQEHASPPTGFDAAIGLSEAAQTFTVGVGGRLAGVDLLLKRNGTDDVGPDLQVEIRATVGGLPISPSSPALAAAAVPRVQTPLDRSFLHVDFPEPRLTVTPGDQLAIVLVAPGGGTEYLWNLIGDTPSGDFFLRNLRAYGADAPWERISNALSFDAGFRTYVEIPEPCGETLAALAVLALAGAITTTRKAQLAAIHAMRPG